METSDSEYFESADEDFEVDETRRGKTKQSSREVHVVSHGVKKVDISDETSLEKSLIENTEEQEDNDTKKVNTLQTEKCSEDKTSNTDVEVNQKSTDKENNKEVKKRSEFGIPPKKVECWEEGVSQIEQDRPRFPVRPTRTVCWVPGVSDVKQNNLPQTDNPESNDSSPKKEENMWEDDNWEPIEQDVNKMIRKTPDVQKPEENNSSWDSWGNWGLSSVLSTATTLTSQVSQGLSAVLESGIGIPKPEDLAKIDKLEEKKLPEESPTKDDMEKRPSFGFGLGNLVQGVSQITKLVETTSNKVISGGLDTLETIGKKTMQVLQENDPGLKKKRAFLNLEEEKPNLSQVLREAKEKAERENKILEEHHVMRKANYEMLFDDYQGLVHLEALEMLSKQCEIKLQTLLESSAGGNLTDIQETLDQVKELCELPEEEDDESITEDEIEEKLLNAVADINVKITYDHLFSTWKAVEEWMNETICTGKGVHQKAVETLAQLTAISMEQFHKSGELLLVKQHRKTVDEADSLVQITTTLTSLIGVIAAKFSEKLNTIAVSDGNKDEISGLITNVFFEAANSSSYIQDAFLLLIPVIQVGAV